MDERREKYNILVSTILQNKAKVGQGLWEIGLALKEIKERELYCVEFDSYGEFLEKKVLLSERTAQRCVEIVTEFTFRDFCKWGLYKLELIKRAFPSEIEVKNKEKFMEQASAEFGEPIEPQIQAFKLEQGIQQISRLKGQVGSPTSSQEEYKFKLLRQAQLILQFKALLTESIDNWLIASKNSQNQEIIDLRKAFENEFKNG